MRFISQWVRGFESLFPYFKMRVIIDSAGHTVGRLFSKIIKYTTDDKISRVFVLNWPAAVYTGSLKARIKKIRAKYKLGTRHHGPYPIKTYRGYFLKGLSGMLPKNRTRARNILSKIRLITPCNKTPVPLKEDIVEKPNMRTSGFYYTVLELFSAIRNKNA